MALKDKANRVIADDAIQMVGQRRPGNPQAIYACIKASRGPRTPVRAWADGSLQDRVCVVLPESERNNLRIIHWSACFTETDLLHAAGRFRPALL
jgi:hypothetical protein